METTVKDMISLWSHNAWWTPGTAPPIDWKSGGITEHLLDRFAAAGPWAVHRGLYPSAWFELLTHQGLGRGDVRDLMHRLDDINIDAMAELGSMVGQRLSQLKPGTVVRYWRHAVLHLYRYACQIPV